ncbi:MAG: hypothetical protein HRF42_14715 [Candidatus Brocadia sp.]|jgi:hypothetical protein
MVRRYTTYAVFADLFSGQITHTEMVTEKECEVGCADAGYADEELGKVDGRGNNKGCRAIATTGIAQQGGKAVSEGQICL